MAPGSQGNGSLRAKSSHASQLPRGVPILDACNGPGPLCWHVDTLQEPLRLPSDEAVLLFVESHAQACGVIAADPLQVFQRTPSPASVVAHILPDAGNVGGFNSLLLDEGLRLGLDVDPFGVAVVHP